jgi:CRP-like cAMP-binding protein
MVKYQYSENLLLRVALASGKLRPGGSLRHIAFEAGQVFWLEHDVIRYALFPIRGVVSLQASAGARQVEAGMVGREGFAGMSLLLGGRSALMSAVALTSGKAFLMPRKIFDDCLGDRRFHDAVRRYARSFLVMLAKTSVCNRVHTIESMYTGRLLLMQDRTHADSFQMTQAFLSRILGVRRATISRAASQLQKQAAILCDRRGRLTILDRGKLEKSACSCYHALKADFDRLVKAQGRF